jgi:hypothetical protein
MTPVKRRVTDIHLVCLRTYDLLPKSPIIVVATLISKVGKVYGAIFAQLQLELKTFGFG